MKLKRLLLGLGLLAVMASSCIGQSLPSTSERVDIVKRGKWLPAGELADGWNIVWDKINDTNVRLDTALVSAEDRITVLESAPGGSPYYAGNGLTLTTTTFSVGDVVTSDILWTNDGSDNIYFGTAGTAFGDIFFATSDGAKYAADYSASYVNRSLVDKEYVDDAIVASGAGVSFGTSNQVPHMNTAGTDYDYDANFTYDGGDLLLGTVGNSYNFFDPTSMQVHGSGGISARVHQSTYHNTAAQGNQTLFTRFGGTIAAPTATATDGSVLLEQYSVYDGSSSVVSGSFEFQVDGAVATGDFDTKATWKLKEGASANAALLILGVDGLEYVADHSTDQAANDRWLPDKAYVDGVSGDATTLNAGTRTTTYYRLQTDGDSLNLPEATTNYAGLLGAGQWNSLTANTAYRTGAIDIDTVAHMLADTLVIIGRIGAGFSFDTAYMHDVTKLFLVPVVQDSLVCDSIRAFCYGAGGDVNLRTYQLDNEDDASKTYIHATINPVTGTSAGTTTFTTPVHGPGKLLGCEIYGEPSTQPLEIFVYLYCHEVRAF